MSVLGYGRDATDGDRVTCPREVPGKPCVARDGWILADKFGMCAGCGMHASTLLQRLTRHVTGQRKGENSFVQAAVFEDAGQATRIVVE